MDLDLETQWDMESIKRFEKLLMFEAEYPVKQMELINDTSLLCLAEKTKPQGNTSLLTIYSLPPRLANSKHNVSLSPHFDLKIVAGTFNKNSITQIACAQTNEIIIASECGADELLVYKLNSNESDKLVMSGVIGCEGLTNPMISVSNDLILATTDSEERISIIDTKGKVEIGKRSWEGTRGILSPLFISPQGFAVCSVCHGDSVLYDTRQNLPVATVNGGNHKEKGWSMDGGYEEGTNTGSNVLGFLSDQGTAMFYDLKNLKTPYSQLGLGSRLCKNQNGSVLGNETSERPQGVVKVNPLNEKISAVGGLDSRIYIIDTGSGGAVDFIHDGHEHCESCLGSDTKTTHHMFYSPGGSRSLISSSDNCSINCWSYNPE